MTFNFLKDEEGFSLLEVSLAVGIMALLTAMAVPTFTGMIPQVKEKVAAENLKQCAIDNKIEALSKAADGGTFTPTTCATASASTQ